MQLHTQPSSGDGQTTSRINNWAVQGLVMSELQKAQLAFATRINTHQAAPSEASMFEDWSALPSGDGKDCFGKAALLPLPLTLGSLGCRNTLWMKSARLLSFFLSLFAIAMGLICWLRFSAIHAGFVQSKSTGIAFNISNLRQLSHMVMVAGHAVVMADSLEHILHKESDWFLESYQRGQDLPQALVGHIKAGNS